MHSVHSVWLHCLHCSLKCAFNCTALLFLYKAQYKVSGCWIYIVCIAVLIKVKVRADSLNVDLLAEPELSFTNFAHVAVRGSSIFKSSWSVLCSSETVQKQGRRTKEQRGQTMKACYQINWLNTRIAISEN